jgi:hypothetical protein
MTNAIILYNYDLTKSVDLTKCHPRISRKGVNPLVIISMPTDKTEKTSKQYSIDLTMVQDNISINFVLKDGIGTNNFASGTTSYEKLWNMFVAGGTKYLVWGDTGMTKLKVVILSLDITNEPGQKDILIGSIVLAVVTKAVAP